MNMRKVFGYLPLVALTACSKPTQEQKLPGEASPKMEVTVPTAATAAKRADLRVRVGIVMKSGDVKPLARTDFILSKLSLAELYQEELAQKPEPTAEDFCKKQNFSPELLQLISTFDWNLERFASSLKMSEDTGQRKVTP